MQEKICPLTSLCSKEIHQRQIKGEENQMLRWQIERRASVKIKKIWRSRGEIQIRRSMCFSKPTEKV
jgi:hypothetical protein